MAGRDCAVYLGDGDCCASWNGGGAVTAIGRWMGAAHAADSTATVVNSRLSRRWGRIEETLDYCREAAQRSSRSAR